MARRAVVFLGGLGLVALVGASAVFVIGMRTNDPRVQDRVRRFNRDVTNPRQMHSAGTPGAYASIVEHRGRTSGRAYRTPVVAGPIAGGFVFALPYGVERTDWLKNVLAAGSAVVVHEGRRFKVDSPELLTAAEANPHFPAAEQRMQRAFGVNDFLRVRTAA